MLADILENGNGVVQVLFDGLILVPPEILQQDSSDR